MTRLAPAAKTFGRISPTASGPRWFNYWGGLVRYITLSKLERSKQGSGHCIIQQRITVLGSIPAFCEGDRWYYRSDQHREDRGWPHGEGRGEIR